MLKKQLTLALFFLSSFAFTQSDTIVILTDYLKEDGLTLKWFPPNEVAFVEGLQNGYNLYRANVNKTSTGEVLGDFKKLNDTPIRLYSYSKYQEVVVKDSSIKLAGLFIDGLEELGNRKKATTPEEAVAQKEEDEFLFLMGIVAMSNTQKSAEAIGLAFQDKTVLEGGKYMYKIELVGNEKLTSYSLINQVKPTVLPKIIGLTAGIYPKDIRLSWFNNNNKEYPYFNIYKSSKKKGPFRKVNKTPYTGDIGTSLTPQYTFFTDSITAYNETVYYQVRGLNFFGKESPASETVKVTTSYLLKESPVITKSEILPGTDKVMIDWEMSDKEIPYMSKFEVHRAPDLSGPYTKVSKRPLNPKTRSFFDETPKTTSSNYYVVSAYGLNGDSVNSIAHARILLDSIPPAKPVFISGECDSSGVITLEWELNKEPDLEGYRIFRTLDTTRDADRLFPGDTMLTSVTDSIDLKKRIRKVYYRIFALDNHFNPSLPSDYIEVEIPDIVPPLNGFLKDYSVGMNGITLEWQPSVSDDLSKTYILRKSETDFDFKPIFISESRDIRKFTDTTTQTNRTYLYATIAEDEVGLKSGLSKVFQIRQFNRDKKKPVKNLQAFASKETRQIKLVWEYNAKAAGFIVYRAEEDKPLEVHRHIDGKDREFYDKNVKPNTTYTYLMIGEIKGGYKSGYSKKVEVKY